MTQLTVRQAAEHIGVSRQTMFRYIQQGRVSSTLSRDGEKQIQVAELLRVFGELQPETVAAATDSNKMRLSPSDSATGASVTFQIELERLRAQLEIKAAELDLAKERIAELKSREHDASQEKNRLLTLIEQQSRLLTAPVKASEEANLVKKPVKKIAAAPKKSTVKKSVAVKKTVKKPSRK